MAYGPGNGKTVWCELATGSPEDSAVPGRSAVSVASVWMTAVHRLTARRAGEPVCGTHGRAPGHVRRVHAVRLRHRCGPVEPHDTSGR
ncbi:hypothetical protein AMK33_08485 [Streptomyces sp. CB02400]|nr:hypothetical protein AMK33_08485 [Streptomyces sp. CB02400]